MGGWGQDEPLLGRTTHLVQGCCKEQGLCQGGLQRQAAGGGAGGQAGSLQRGLGPVGGGRLEHKWGGQG